MKHINIPIGFKLITITTLILLTSLVGINYIAGVFFERDTITRIQEITADKSRLLSLKVQADITYMMSRVRNVFQAMLNDQEFNGRGALPDLPKEGALRVLRAAGQAESNSEEFHRPLREPKYLFYVAIYQASAEAGTLLQDQINAANSIGATDVEFFRDITRRSVFLSKPPKTTFLYNVTSVADLPALALLFPLEGMRAGTTAATGYFALAYLSEDIFSEAISSVSEYETYIVNHQGDLLSHKDAELLRGEASFLTDGIVQAMLKSPLNNGQLSYQDRMGIQRIGSFFKLELGTIGVVSTAERDQILQAVYQIRRRNYYITGIVLLISVMIIYLFAKTLSKPIRRLVAASREIKKGNFLLNIKVSSRDEIGDLTQSFIQMGRGLDERNRMKDALGKFVNEEIANMALKGELRLGGELKEAAVFFSDIRSFTAISEKLTPEEVVEFLNEYMTAMVGCIEATYGVVDKFIGDAVMAVWGAPISHGNDTENAINSALLMRQALENFNQGRGGEKQPVIKIGCGINTGPLVSGQIGSENRMEYTVIGDAVNLASRIEELTKPFGVDILISENSHALVDGLYYTAEMPQIMVKGKSDPIKIYAVLGRRDNPKAIQEIAELRKYLGTENVDLSKFDRTSKEEKFSAVGNRQLEKTAQEVSHPTAETEAGDIAEFIQDAGLVQPQPVAEQRYLTDQLLTLREAVIKRKLEPATAARQLRELQEGPLWPRGNRILGNRMPGPEEKIKISYVRKLLNLKTALKLGEIPEQKVKSELLELKRKMLRDRSLHLADEAGEQMSQSKAMDALDYELSQHEQELGWDLSARIMDTLSHVQTEPQEKLDLKKSANGHNASWQSAEAEQE